MILNLLPDFCGCSILLKETVFVEEAKKKIEKYLGLPWSICLKDVHSGFCC